jgi:hypothetical protein
MDPEISYHGATSCKIEWPNIDKISAVPLFRTRVTIDTSGNPLCCRLRYFVADSTAAAASGECGLLVGLDDGRAFASECLSFEKAGGSFGWNETTFSADFPLQSKVSMVGLWGTRGCCIFVGEMDITQKRSEPLHELKQGSVTVTEHEIGSEVVWDDIEDVDRWEVFLNGTYLGVSYVSRYMLDKPLLESSAFQILGFNKFGQKILQL